MNNIDVIVIGGGHAGCEAALASARMGVKTVLVTSNIEKIAMAPCNPSIGGPAKGIVVREIDALGGEMGRNTDLTHIQIKILNRSKGPAVHSLRAQIDKVEYPKQMQKTILNTENLQVVEELVSKLIFNEDHSQVLGIELENGQILKSKTVVLTTGTYMDSFIINGQTRISAGPEGTKTTNKLSESLRDANVELFKLKTGTPARVKRSSIDFSKASVTGGDTEKLAFGFYNPVYQPSDNQEDCYLIHTSPRTHQIIQENLSKSAMYSGVIEGVGPRYCPSIEDKIVRFSDKDRHQLFLEPETRNGESIYIQGFSTSMPYEIQDEMIRSLPGLENAEILMYGYAIEYDAVKPEQLHLSLEFKDIENLYSAGQINGTSGYEEAAGQGIVAGINAALKVQGKEPLILTRDNSYIGLMIDDLITKGTEEPYRLLTSRSEYRLHLRNDNADIRLTELGYKVGLISEERYAAFNAKLQMIEDIKALYLTTNITQKMLTSELAQSWATVELNRSMTIYELMKRPTIDTVKIKELVDLSQFDDVTLYQVEVLIKYEGYIAKLDNQIKRQLKMQTVKIPMDIDYDLVDNLALEAREKLKKIRPENLGQASRISGINPVDISVLHMYMENEKRGKNAN